MADLNIGNVLGRLSPNLGLFTLGEVVEDDAQEMFYIRLWANPTEDSPPEFVIQATVEPIGSVAVIFDHETQVLTFGVSLDIERKNSDRWAVLDALNTRNATSGLITVFCLAPEEDDVDGLAIDCSASLALSEALLEEEAEPFLVSLIHATLARFTYESWHWVDVLYDTVCVQ